MGSVIVQGVFRVAPVDQEAFLAEKLGAMQISRAERGCLEYVIAADPLEPGRLVLSERWATIEDLSAHSAAMAQRREDGTEPAGVVEVLSREVAVYEVASERRLG